MDGDVIERPQVHGVAPTHCPAGCCGRRTYRCKLRTHSNSKSKKSPYSITLLCCQAVGCICTSRNKATYQSRSVFMFSGAGDKILKKWLLPVHSFLRLVGRFSFSLFSFLLFDYYLRSTSVCMHILKELINHFCPLKLARRSRKRRISRDRQ